MYTIPFLLSSSIYFCLVSAEDGMCKVILFGHAQRGSTEQNPGLTFTVM